MHVSKHIPMVIPPAYSQARTGARSQAYCDAQSEIHCRVAATDTRLRAERGSSGRTLGDLVRAKMALVAVCRHCRHRRLIYPANLILRFGENCPALQLRKRMRCETCKAVAATLHAVSR
jgi:hypothetical protein